MPRPVSRNSSYHPGLDGIRAIAVAVVFAYHLGWSWAPGGLLGVGVFFTLSGYLITTILLDTWQRRGHLDLGEFWLRRARRLLPAVVLVLTAVLVTTWYVDHRELDARAESALAALFYLANWKTILTGDSYFDRFTGPGPLDHLWSLSIEEQFYLVWPLLLIVLLKVLRGRLTGVAAVTTLLAAGSFWLLWVIAVPGFENTRAYQGTDTRAGALLVGAAVAMLWRPSRLRGDAGWPARIALDVAGVAALGVIVGMVITIDQMSLTLYRGGILALSIATAVLVAVAVHPASAVGRLLGVGPMRWVGERSYGIYLWHLPVLVFLPGALLANRPWYLTALVIGLTGLLAALSWALLEDPIRRYGVVAALRLGRRAAEPGASPALVAAVALTRRGRWLVLPAALTLAIVGTASIAAAAMLHPPPPVQPVAIAPPAGTTPPSSAPPSSAPKPSVPPAKYETSCRSVVHVGDSTSLGEIDEALDTSKRLDARYAAVGVRDVDLDILGARSIVERYKGQPNAQEAVQARVDAGYTGCWVIAMGINEVANQAAGATVPLDERIDLVMRRIRPDQPVLWLSVKTLVSPDTCTSLCAWAEPGMPKFGGALAAACKRYPNMRVYDWAGQARDAWFGDDEIHYTPEGATQRADRTARALAMAFPRDGVRPASCFVSPP